MLENKQKGERLEFIFNAFKMKKTEFAALLGVPPQRLSDMFREGRHITEKVLQRLEEVGVNTKFIFYEDETKVFKPNMDLQYLNKEVPMKLTIRETSGDSTEIELKDILDIEIYDIPANANVGSLVSFYDLPFSVKRLGMSMKLNPAKVKGIRVSGDSMRKDGLEHGGLAIYDISAVPIQGDIVVAVLNNVVIIKRYYVNNDGIIELRSADDKIPPIIVNEIDDNLQILGVVRARINL